MFKLKFIFCLLISSLSHADFTAYNDCIRHTGDTTVDNVTNWTFYNGFTANTTGKLIDYATGEQTSITATITWNTAKGIDDCTTCGSADGESQPRSGTPAYEVFGGIIDFSDTIQYGNSGWWLEITFTGLNPSRIYTLVGTAIRGANYPLRQSLYTLSGHLSADNNSSDGIYLKNGNQTVLIAGGNHLATTGYVVRWDNITVADTGDGTGSFKVRAEAYTSEYRAYPFGGFMLQEFGNASPVVNAGADQTITLPKTYLTLTGTVSDDGNGNPNGYLQSTWSQVSGPAEIEFTTDIHQPEITAKFPAAGEYQLQLTTTDGELTRSDTVIVTVQESPCPLGDIDSDCQVSLSDVRTLASSWLVESTSIADLNGDGIADIEELYIVAKTWLEDWTGALTVTITPAEAVAGGALWRLDGGQWQSSDATISDIPEGTHQVDFAVISGWASPDPQTITISRQQTTTVTGTYYVPEQTIAINEFLAVNSNITDIYPAVAVNTYTQVNGEPAYEDWIELYNETDQTVDLGGWYLTDDPDDLTKWQIPAGYSLAGKSYMVIYASNKSASKYDYPFVDDLGNLHTNFELSTGGEYLALVRPDGQWVEYEYNDYPKQRGLVSYGIDPNGTVGYLTGVTQGSANTGIYKGLVADTKFDSGRGFYDTAQTVHLTCSTPDAVIRYTTDTTEPTSTNGLVYNSNTPISVTTTTCLRAVAFKDGWLASNIDTQTYIFLNDVIKQATNTSTSAQVTPTGYPEYWISYPDGDTVVGDYQMDPDITTTSGLYGSLYAATIKNDLKDIPSISVVVPVEQLFGTFYGIYVNEGQDGSERVGSVEFIDPNGIEKWNTNCGLRMQGGADTSASGGTTLDRWKCKKLSISMMFRGVYEGNLKYPVFKDSNVDSFDTIILDSRPQTSWVHSEEKQRIWGDYTRDQLASNTQIALGGYACHGRPVHLYLNGLYWGMYWLHERPNDAFAASYLGGDKEDYDVIKHEYTNVLNGDNTDYIAMFNLSVTSPDAVTAFNNLKAKLDVEDFFDYMITNYYLGNGDWDHKNWYATRNHFKTDGRWRWHMWDGEHVFGEDGSQYWYSRTDNTGYRITAMGPTGLHWKWIAANAEYRMLFADRVHKHFFHDGALTPENYLILFNNLTSQIDRAIVGESARWGDYRRDANPYTRNNEWLTECNRMRTLITTRRDIVLNQFNGTVTSYTKDPVWYPLVTAPEFYINSTAQYGGDADVSANLTITAGNTIWYTTDGTDPRAAGGAVNSTATTYSSAITLTKSTAINARAISTAGVWSALATATFDVGAVQDDLRVTELMYHAEDPNLDFVELKNIGTETINLNLVQFTDGILHTFGDVSVAAGSFVLLVKNKTMFEAYYTSLPTGTTVIQWTDGSLDNDSEKITITDSMGRTIQSFSYEDSWFDLTDGGGFSLTILDPASSDLTLWDRKAGWRASMTAGGSPGADEVGLAPGSILINEILAHSDDTLPDWVELYNTTTQSISIAGWFLSDDETTLTKYTIPDGIEIAGGGYVVLYEDQHFCSAFALSENGETLYLTSGAAGAITGYQVSQEFDASLRNVSMGRHITSTGDVDFVAMSSPTAGDENAYPAVGPIVISEIQYNPAAANTGDEYIELHNISSAAVTLQDTVTTEATEGVFTDEVVSWSFTNGIDFTFPADTQIPAGGFLILAKNPTAFSSYYAATLPAGTQVLGPFENDTSLSNGGEKVRLCRPGEQPYGQERLWIRVDQVNYDDASPWPTTPDGGGMTLQRTSHTLYGNDPASWTAASPAPGL